MRPKHESGQVLPLVGLTLATMLGFGGVAVDVGYWDYAQQWQQNATDAAAVGGAEQLVKSNCTSPSNAKAAALADAASNGFSTAGNVTVTPNSPPQSGPFANSSCAVSVTITSNHVASYFSRLFGVPAGVTESTQAVATASATNNGCIYMLSPSQNTNFHSGNVQAVQCSIYMNGSANFSGATVDAAAIGEANYAGSNNAGTFAEGTPAPILPVADPCSEMAGCAYLTNNPPSTAQCTSTYGGNGTLSPGCYNNLNLNGATVTLSPGLYVFAGGMNMNMASITGSGVTIYIPAGATTNFNKVNAMTLSPPTSGNYAGVTYYQVSSNSTTVNLNGSSTVLSGLIYAPTAQLNYNGSLGQYTIIVAAYANLNNSSGEDFGTPPPEQSIVGQAVIVQ